MTRRTLIGCLAYLAVLVVAAVGVDRALAHLLFAEPGRMVPAYRSFQEASVGDKLQELDKTPGTFDTLFLGNSRTLFGVEPVLVDHVLRDRGIDERSFNLAMPTLDVRFWPAFLDRYYDRPAPSQLVLGVIPRDLDSRNVVAAAKMQTFFHSPGFENRHRSGVWRDAEEVLAKLFTLRGRFNDIRSVPVLQGERAPAPQIRISGRGWGRLAPGIAPSKAYLAEQAQRLAVRSGSMRLDVGASQIGALGALNDWIRSRGGCLTLFTPPVLYDREPWGTLQVRSDFYRVLGEFVRSHPTVRLLDLGPAAERRYTLDDYSDGDHLSPDGARRFSRTLANALATPDPDCRPRT